MESEKTQFNALPLLKLLRSHHWCKNLLLFVPLLTANQLSDTNKLLLTCIGFICFSLTASFGYIINDIFDYQSDQLHPRKKNRPIAAELVTLKQALLFGSLILTSSLFISMQLDLQFTAFEILYLMLAFLYTIYAKKIFFADVIILAVLFTTRVIAGAVLTDVYPSLWLISFSLTFFLSLAIIKRIAEFSFYMNKTHTENNGRYYTEKHLKLLKTLGVTASIITLFIFCFYTFSQDAHTIYNYSSRLLAVLVLLGIWLSRLWILVCAGRLYDDPIVFAIRDKFSYAIGSLILITVMLAH